MSKQVLTAGHVYRRLLSYALPHWKAFALALLGMAVYAATDTGFAALMKPMLDGSFVERDPQTIRWVPLILIGLFFVRGLASFGSSYGMTWVGRQVIKRLRGDLFQHLLYLPAAFYSRTSTGKLVSKLIYNVDQVAGATTNVVTVLVRDTLTALGLLAWMFYLNAALALIFVVVGPFVTVLVVYLSRRFRKISRRIQRSMGDVTHLSEEAIEGQRVVKAFGGQERESRQFEDVNERNRRIFMKFAATNAASAPIIQLIAAAVLAAIIFLATVEPVTNRITVGEFVSFITAMLLLLPALKRLTAINGSLQKGIAAGESLFELLDEPPERDKGTRQIERASGAVAYRQVSFSYPDDDQRVLKDISFQAEPGQVIAFVGRSGSGKSTLVSLLARLYDPVAGAVLLDGVDIREIPLADLRRQIAFVDQSVTLFNATVADNIAYGSLAGASRADIERAAEAAHAMEFIRSLPQGLDTVVGGKGLRLSGGQRQRLAIARALLKDAPVLILDEATSALDTESERHIQAALEHLMAKRTTLVIAHRLSTVEHADRIVVLRDGGIVEQGTHGELLERQGHYADLYRMQFAPDRQRKSATA